MPSRVVGGAVNYITFRRVISGLRSVSRRQPRANRVSVSSACRIWATERANNDEICLASSFPTVAVRMYRISSWPSKGSNPRAVGLERAGASSLACTTTATALISWLTARQRASARRSSNLAWAPAGNSRSGALVQALDQLPASRAPRLAPLASRISATAGRARFAPR